MTEPKPSSGGASTGPASSDQRSQTQSSLGGTSGGLRLIALDSVDLTIIAAHLQDAVCRVRDLAFVPQDHRFVLLLNRFDWSTAETPAGPAKDNLRNFERRRCALRFEHVRAAKVTGFSQRDKRQVLSLLTIGFEQSREGDPDGLLTLLFAGGGAIRLDVEYIEAELTDLGAGWRTKAKPEHPEF